MKNNYLNLQNRLAWLWLLILISAATSLIFLLAQDKLKIQTDIFKLLPQGQFSEQAQVANQKVGTLINEKVFFLIEANNSEAIDKATIDIITLFSQSKLWQSPKPVLDIKQFGQILYQHKAGLLADLDRELLQTEDFEGITEQALAQILSPGVPINADLLASDPLLFFPRYLLALAQNKDATMQNIELKDGWPTLQHGNKYYRLFIFALTNTPYNIDYQTETMQWLKDVKLQLAEQNINTYITGTLLFASAGTQSAHNEVSTIGVGSSIGLIILILFGFRSFRPLFTEFAAVCSGCIMAVLITNLIFSEIHLITLVFGASLIGVSIDFSFYYLFVQSEKRNLAGIEVLKQLLPSLFMGLITTIAAYLCLMLTPFPGLRQIAVFSVVGLATAWITSMLLLPKLPPLRTNQVHNLLSWLGKIREFFLYRRYLRYALVAIVLAISPWTLTNLHFDDDIRNLQSMDAKVLQEELKIRELFSQQRDSQYFVVTGDNLTQVETQEAKLLEKLDILQQQGSVGGFQALGMWLPPQTVQVQNIELLKTIPTEYLLEYAQTIGLDDNIINAWQANLNQQPLLQQQDMQNHPTAEFALSDNQRIVLLSKIKDYAAVKNLELDIAGVEFIDPVGNLSQIFAEYRNQSQERLMLGIGVLTLILVLSYGFKAVPSLIIPVCMALITTFSIQAMLGISINLFNIMAAFLILGIGVDYAIFYNRSNSSNRSVTHSMFLCMLASILGFGLLSLSNTHAIFSFGLTVLLGVLFAFIYASLLTMPKDGLQNK